jgi:hypothetical protein
LFTIIFGTIIATLVKRYALWKAQEGATIAKLEQYQASISLPGTLKTIVSLRSWTLTSVCLVLLWSFAYLGSQAVQHEYTYQLASSALATRVFFRSAQAPSFFQNSSGLKSDPIVNVLGLSSINSMLLSSAVTMGTPSSRSDMYSQPIVPLMNQTEGMEFGTPDILGWQAIQETSIFASSYLGLPVYWASSGESTSAFMGTYDLSTSYIFADCAEPIVGNVSSFPTGLLPNMATSFNMTNETSTNGFPVLDLWLRSNQSSFHSSCELKQHHVQLQGSCQVTTCQFNKIRPDTPFVAPATMFFDQNFTTSFFDALLMSNGVPEIFRDISLFTQILKITYDDVNDIWPYSDGFASSSPSPATGFNVSLGLSKLLNTYVRASQTPSGPWNEDGPLDFDFMAGLMNGSITNSTWSTAPADGSPYNPQYVLSWPWIVIDLITCTLLLAAAVESFRLRRLTVAPDIFGYISSLTRDNPNMRLPEGGTTLSGWERTRALKDVRVKIADLNHDGHVGRIGLTVEDRGEGGAHLNRAKNYL